MGGPGATPLENLEKDGLVDMQDVPVEIQSLRQELKQRILFQNMLLQALLVLFSAFAIVVAVMPEASSLLHFAFQCVVLSGASQWCHHGVRTAQIKAYLQEINADETHGHWESWLPAHRPKTFLGSRWQISTKGVFLGLGLGMFLLDAVFTGPPELLPLLCSAAVWSFAAYLLISNPKE